MTDSTTQAAALAVASMQAKHSPSFVDPALFLRGACNSAVGTHSRAAPLLLSSISMLSTASILTEQMRESNFITNQIAVGAALTSYDDVSSPFGSALTSSLTQCSDPKEEDPEKRLSRSRERNREHARRTRLRKKAQMQELQAKVKELSTEHKCLKQRVEECSIASILIGLSANTADDEICDSLDATLMDDEQTAQVAMLTDGTKRCKRMLVDSVLRDQNKGYANQTAIDTLRQELGDDDLTGVGGKSHINWKTGLYHDSHGNEKQLTTKQLETLR